jgi:8-oxo-dGTP diphosphatase
VHSSLSRQQRDLEQRLSWHVAFEDTFRISVHAVITDDDSKVLQLRQTYGDKRWGLPGGALEPGETIHEAIERECAEELGVEVLIEYLSGLYYHKAFNSQVGIFRARLQSKSIRLSAEHSDYRFFSLSELSPVQRHRVQDCLEFDGKVRSHKF